MLLKKCYLSVKNRAGERSDIVLFAVCWEPAAGYARSDCDHRPMLTNQRCFNSCSLITQQVQT